MLRWLLRHLSARHAANLLLLAQVVRLTIITLLLLALMAGAFFLFAWVSGSSTMQIDAEIQNGHITGQMYQVGPIGGLLGSLVAFLLAFVAGAVCVQPLLSRLRLFCRLRAYKYESLVGRMPKIIDMKCEADKVDIVREVWGRNRQQVLENYDFQRLVDTVTFLQENLKP